jgi:hypothetical protein
MKSMKRELRIHEPTTKEIYFCLSRAIEWCEIIAKNTIGKPYNDFLKWLIEHQFFKTKENVTVKWLSEEFKKPARNIKQWISQIYDDIFELNDNSPELFLKDGIRVSLLFNSHDNFTGFDISVRSVPRENETVRFPFVQAKIGMELFWVDKVDHSFSTEQEISIWLIAGFPNRYRKFALDKAEFQGEISFWDLQEKYSFELDDTLRKIYRH